MWYTHRCGGLLFDISSGANEPELPKPPIQGAAQHRLFGVLASRSHGSTLDSKSDNMAMLWNAHVDA